MRQRDIVLVCSLLAVIVLGMFVYTYLERKTVDTPTPEPAPSAETLPYVTRIDGKHFYVDGVHTIVGEVLLPTPCDLLTYDALIQETYPEQISFNFDVINNSDSCAQVVTAQRFLVSATASPEATMSATFMGHKVELNLIEAAPNETPDSFELFIKG